MTLTEKIAKYWELSKKRDDANAALEEASNVYHDALGRFREAEHELAISLPHKTDVVHGELVYTRVVRADGSHGFTVRPCVSADEVERVGFLGAKT